jgi:carbon-monoxide dehydrogenase medium subunit
MIPSSFRYHLAGSLDDATQVLVDAGDGARVISGGQSLIPFMRLRFANPTVLVDISRVPDLATIRVDGGTLRVGALARHHDVETSAVVREQLPLLAEVASHIGDGQVRNRGTIGGAVAHADPAGEYPALALALGAQIVTTRRTIAAEDFFLGRYTTPLEHGEIVTEIALPTARGHHAYLKFGKDLFDWAVVGVMTQALDDGWRIGLVSAGETPVRALAAERALAAGASPAQAAAAAVEGLDPTPTTRASADYKRHLVRVLVERALTRTGG